MNDGTPPARSAAQQVLSGIGNWTLALNQVPGWETWSRKRFGRVLYSDDTAFPHEEIKDFDFPEVIDREHGVIMAYMELIDVVDSLREVEWYFRRYPFSDHQVSKGTHLSNCCDLYFGKFYQFKERIKNLFDAVSVCAPGNGVQVGSFIKLFSREFAAELRERNRVHHRERFEDMNISSVLIQSQLATKMPESNWRQRSQNQYRKICKEWASRVNVRADRLDMFVEAIAAELLRVCPFFNDSTQSGA